MMALFNCPECEARISDKAAACPHCGYPLATQQKGEPLREEFPFMAPLTQFAEVVSRTMRDVMEPIVEESRRRWRAPEAESKKAEEPPKEKE
jgi:predicted amidophosphoribosyltransferase